MSISPPKSIDQLSIISFDNTNNDIDSISPMANNNPEGKIDM